MSQEPDIDQTVTVSRGDVTVEKSFEPDEFPVPAVLFRIDSADSDPVELRLVDQIPEEYQMSAIGFHPDFESDNWMAYQDHRVVFERTLDPEEVVQTVYGVRLDREEDAVAFLDNPTLEGIEESAESVDDILGEDRNQAVRDVLAGDRDSLTEAEEKSTTAEAEQKHDTLDTDPGEHETRDDAGRIKLNDSDDEEDVDEIDLNDSKDEEDVDEIDPPESEDGEPTTDQSQAESREQETPAPRSLGDGAASVVEKRSPDAVAAERHEVTQSDTEPTDESETEADQGESEPTVQANEEPTSQPEQEPDTEADQSVKPPAAVGVGSSETATGGVAEALAQEIRDGDVPDRPSPDCADV